MHELRILCLDVGSSSVKYALYKIGNDEQKLLEGSDSDLSRGIEPALERIAAELEHRGTTFDAVGQRVVFGGAERDAPAKCDATVLAAIEKALDLFPLHLAKQLQSIRFVEKHYPLAPQVLCFDTAFHATMPQLAKTLPLPASLGHEVRRYGFHGLSYEYIVSSCEAASQGKVIVAHLGSGASLCALRDGKSADTTMGISALGGLMMGTRPGDLDPGVLLYLLERGWSAEQVNRTLNEESGLLGVSGLSADVRTLEEQYQTDDRAALALDLFCYLARKQIGSLLAVLDGLDTMIFTGGIGENSALVRRKICADLGFAGVTLDIAKNEANATDISTKESRARVMVVHTDENRMIARHVYRILK
jgi:acetate kinase